MIQLIYLLPNPIQLNQPTRQRVLQGCQFEYKLMRRVNMLEERRGEVLMAISECLRWTC